VIPCFRVCGQILHVLTRIGPEVDSIYAVDDKCPDGSGRMITEKAADRRIKVIHAAHPAADAYKRACEALRENAAAELPS
jgi:hypothetical protein